MEGPDEGKDKVREREKVEGEMEREKGRVEITEFKWVKLIKTFQPPKSNCTLEWHACHAIDGG